LSKPTLNGSIVINHLINLQYCGLIDGKCFILTGYSGANFKIFRIDDNYSGNPTVRDLTVAFSDTFGPISAVKNILSYIVDESSVVRFLIVCTIIVDNISVNRLLDISIDTDSNPPSLIGSESSVILPDTIYDLKYAGAPGSTVIAVGTSTAYTYDLTTQQFAAIDATIDKNYRTVCFLPLVNKWVFVGNDLANGPITLNSGLTNPTQQTFVGDVTTNTFVYSWASPNYVYFIARDAESSGHKATLFRWDPTANIIYPVVYNGGNKPFIAGNDQVTDVLAGYSDGIVLRNADGFYGAGDKLYMLYDTNIHVVPSGGGEPAV